MTKSALRCEPDNGCLVSGWRGGWSRARNTAFVFRDPSVVWSPKARERRVSAFCVSRR